MRHLAGYGVGVNVIVDHPYCAAGWSRCAERRYAGPVEKDSMRYLDRLLAIGKADPGQVLLPTSDETAWLYIQRVAPRALFPPVSATDRNDQTHPRQGFA